MMLLDYDLEKQLFGHFSFDTKVLKIFRLGYSIAWTCGWRGLHGLAPREYLWVS